MANRNEMNINRITDKLHACLEAARAELAEYEVRGDAWYLTSAMRYACEAHGIADALVTLAPYGPEIETAFEVRKFCAACVDFATDAAMLGNGGRRIDLTRI